MSSVAQAGSAAIGLPPGSELPRSRQTARWMARPVEFMRSLQESHGDVFSIHLLQEEPWVVVSDPALVKRIFTAPGDVLHAGEPKRILEPVLGPSSVLLNDGERHMRARRLLLPPFHGARLKRYERRMREVAEREIDRWPLGIAAPAAPRFSAIALEVILRTVFGIEEEKHLGPLRAAFAGLMEYASHSPRPALVALGDGARLADERFAQFRRLLDRVDDLVYDEIARRRGGRRAQERDDILSLLLQARHEDGSGMSDAELRDELLTLVIAGHETTASSLSWALERLARAPQALERAAAEAPAGGPFTDAVVLETLRLRPVFMVAPRRVRKPFRLSDKYLLPPGVTVTPSIPLVHLRAESYPDPETFLPERFLGKRPGTYSWIPFGGGVRRCIGAGFSLLEMGVVLSTLLGRVRLRLDDAEPEPARRRLLVMAPSRGAEVMLEQP